MGILLLLETHLPQGECFRATQLNHKGGANFWNNALFSPKGDRFYARTRSVVGNQLVPYIVDHGLLIEEELVYNS